MRKANIVNISKIANRRVKLRIMYAAHAYGNYDVIGKLIEIWGSWATCCAYMR